VRGLGLAALLAGCASGDCPPGWKPLFDESQLTRPVLAGWTDGSDTWLVGGPVGAVALESLVLRDSGGGWSPLATGRHETLWWVWGTSDGSEVWMVGEAGLVLRWRASGFEVIDAGVTGATLFGVWGSGPEDVWVVGGNPGGGTRVLNDVVRHFDGHAWSAADAPPARGAAFFKIWGPAAGDFWIVGEDATLWHHTASGWDDHAAEIGTRDSLTTVHGCASDEVYTVGGMGIYVWRGSSWQPASGVTPQASVNGVACAADEVLAVGNGGLKLRYDRAANQWHDETLAAPFYTDFHGALVAGPGRLYAVGGNYNSPVSGGRVGIAAFYGCPVPK
jgi:hypothetical protein